MVCPRLLEIIYEINHRFLKDVRQRYPDDENRISRMSLFEDKPVPQVRMAHLAIVGTHSTNGVAKIHSDLLRTRVVADFAQVFPERFNNKTNGVTPRRWLLLANPDLSKLVTETIGDGWVTDLSQLSKLLPLADDASFRAAFRQTKHAAKERFAAWLKSTTGQIIDPDTIFDSQIKRIHEYKRQLLNVLHIVVLYNRLRANPNLHIPSRTFFFAGKAAPAYRLAKLIIKLISNVSRVIDDDPSVRGRIKVVFLPNYNVTLAERLIPASDVSEQISTAGFEASGTGNMKFMINGALTIGTRDGATIEMAEAAGEENFFLFGLTAEQVQSSRGWYITQPWHYANEFETREALDLIFSDHFSRDEWGIFTPLRAALLDKGDYYMHLADLTSPTRRPSSDWENCTPTRRPGIEKRSPTSPAREISPAIALSTNTPPAFGTQNPALWTERCTLAAGFQGRIMSILTINGGSSSIKFALYTTSEPLQRSLCGKIDRIGLTNTTLTFADPIKNKKGALNLLTDCNPAEFLINWLESQTGFASVQAIGHRVVHGMMHTDPELVTPELLSELNRIKAYSPEHLPRELELIEAFQQHLPKLPQVACFDTAFHRTMPRVASSFPLPRHFYEKGVQRFGFHGLSCTYLMENLESLGGKKAAQGRVILAHLGNGASLTAVKEGKSIDTSMGFTPSAGIPMSTRSGDLDPGLILYLLQTEQMTAQQFYDMVNHQSGLLGISETSSDMRDLLTREKEDARAAEAVAMFCYQTRKWIGAYAAALGGLDTLVFSGGIGENAAPVRARICEGLRFLGLEMDATRNAAHDSVISTAASSIVVRIIRTNEELMIAKSVSRVLNLNSQ